MIDMIGRFHIASEICARQYDCVVGLGRLLHNAAMFHARARGSSTRNCSIVSASATGLS